MNTPLSHIHSLPVPSYANVNLVTGNGLVWECGGGQSSLQNLLSFKIYIKLVILLCHRCNL